MKTMKLWRIILVMTAAMLSLASCSSDPQWADEEAHEKTNLLRQQYAPIIVGMWHVEYVKEKGRFFERLTFNADGTFTGMRKWQIRELVSIDGEQKYTDWQDIENENGTFMGKWKLSWERDAESALGANRIMLSADFDGDRAWPAYSLNTLFIHADETKLCFTGGLVHNGDNGETIYTRGDGEPSF